ncbi:rhodanese-related sulfurtransferase [Aquirhabdus sp.]|uniref:oxygen-dependent tRNA uridine(34) hydroxylase TrhO n=1 Tax=Aquirhabdus sp. TaxID=2824160 RepID=UPI00396C4B8A
MNESVHLHSPSDATIDDKIEHGETSASEKDWVIAALYQFHPVSFPADLRNRLDELSTHLQLRGTLIVASEGINGTVAGSRAAIDELHQVLINEGFDRMEYKESFSREKPFKRMKVKFKEEIVTLGVDVEPLAQVGHYLEPEAWHDFIQQEDVLVIDTRNRYEYAAGTFKNAIDPNTETFREFPAFVDEQLADAKHKKIAMFCTGGIRCEKSTSLLLQQGFEEVYHLKGGILNYLNTIPEEESLWKGECFVFDGRVGVGHGVEEGESAMCFGCGWPLKRHELQSVKFERGVSCPHCFDQTSEAQKARYRMRQKQMDGDI